MENLNQEQEPNISTGETETKELIKSEPIEIVIPNTETKTEKIPKEENEHLSSGQKARLTRAINEFKSDANKLLGEIRDTHTKILELNTESGEVKKKIDTAFTDIENKVQSSNEKNAKIIELHNKIFVSSEEESCIDDDIKEATEAIKQAVNEIQGKKAGFNEYYAKIFGTKNEAGEEVPGLKQEIEKNKTELNNLHKQESEKFKALFEKIEGLLPGATSAGLAKTFADQKKQYRIPNIIWSIVFVITMLIMAGFGAYTWKDIVDANAITLSFVLSKILARTPFFIATIWLGYFASKQQSQNKRLEQEYAHKENVSRSYEGFKRQINSLEQTDENKEISLKLLANIVESVGYNPSITLDNESHREEPPLIDKALSLFTGGKKKSETQEE